MPEPLEDNPNVQEIRKLLTNFTQREPYITNTAIRIYLEIGKQVTPIPPDIKGAMKLEYKRGYTNGYNVGKYGKGSTPSPQPQEGKTE